MLFYKVELLRTAELFRTVEDFRVAVKPASAGPRYAGPMGRDQSAGANGRLGGHGVAEKLRQDIDNGVYPAGAELPVYRQLAASYGTTLGTISNAVHRLEQMGYVSVSQGRRAKVRDRTVPVSAEAQLAQLRAELRDMREVVREAGATAAALEQRLTGLVDGIQVKSD